MAHEVALVRLWSLHPRYLDRQGLTATWREALLAQAVLAGRTKGYTRHPQLRRFQATPDPVATIGAYLELVADEASGRGYRYDRSRIITRATDPAVWAGRLEVSTGQLEHEWGHLVAKLALRSPEWLASLKAAGDKHEDGLPAPHPLFRVVEGPVADWEIV